MIAIDKRAYLGAACLATSVLCACGGGGGGAAAPAPLPALPPAPAPAPVPPPPAAPAPPPPSSACPTCRGADPTPESVEANAGPYPVQTLTVTQASGAPATIYYPAGSSEVFGAIVTMPGYQGDQSNLQWLGPRLASNGFVVINVDTASLGALPDARAADAVQAIRQVISLGATSTSPLFGKVDATRLGMIGHSMGGGAALVAARDNPSLFKAIVPLAPWYDKATRDFPSPTPTLVFVCTGDTTATVNGYAVPIYDGLTSPAKAYVEGTFTARAGKDAHNCVHSDVANQPKLGKDVVSWMKLWLDSDPRYSPFICGPQNPGTDAGFTNVWGSTCPF